MKQNIIPIIFICVSTVLIALIVGIAKDRQEKQEHDLPKAQSEIIYKEGYTEQVHCTGNTKKDTAFVISSFLKTGITYIDKENIKLIDSNYYPSQEKNLSSLTVTLKGNKAIVGTDCHITHTVQSEEYWEFESDFFTNKIAVLKTDRGEIRIAEVSSTKIPFGVPCAIEVRYGNYWAISSNSVVYCRLQGEVVDDKWYPKPNYFR